MIDSLCQAYHWTLPEAMRLTLPQIFMLNHAAHINSKRMDERIERDKVKRDKAERAEKLEDKRNPYIPEFGKRLLELNSNELGAYYAELG